MIGRRDIKRICDMVRVRRRRRGRAIGYRGERKGG